MQTIEGRSAVITGAARGTGLLRLPTDPDPDDAIRDRTTAFTGGGARPGPAAPNPQR